MPSRSTRRRPPTLLICTVLALLTIVAVLLSLRTGAIDTGWRDLVGLLGFGQQDSMATTALLQLRLPRLIAALLAGAVLAMAGATLQGILRNPLADPGLIGISGGAGLAAALAMVLANQLFGADAGALLPLAAFTGAAVATLFVTRLAQVQGRTHIGTLLLAGVAINAICGAGIGLMLHIADEAALRGLTFWLFGSFSLADWRSLAYCAPPLLLAIILLPFNARALNALLLGEAEARHVGVDIESLKRRAILLLVLGVGAAVALAGMIGFVGLLVPHLIRLLFGPDHRLLLPASGLLGGLLLALADTMARSMAAPIELPIGVLTALIGGPFFLWLLVRNRQATGLA
jgi:iron complex transport system permease protein